MSCVVVVEVVVVVVVVVVVSMVAAACSWPVIKSCDLEWKVGIVGRTRSRRSVGRGGGMQQGTHSRCHMLEWKVLRVEGLFPPGRQRTVKQRRNSDPHRGYSQVLPAGTILLEPLHA